MFEKQAERLSQAWRGAHKVAERIGSERAWDDAQEAYTRLCDYVDEVGLTYTKYDPREDEYFTHLDC